MPWVSQSSQSDKTLLSLGVVKLHLRAIEGVKNLTFFGRGSAHPRGSDVEDGSWSGANEWDASSGLPCCSV